MSAEGTERNRYVFGLRLLLGLFILRVLAQALIAVGAGGFLPPWEEWFSGVIAYPQLLASQLVIILLYGKICRDVSRGTGAFGAPRRWLGSAVLAIGSVYFVVMVLRYTMRMALYPPERWTGGSIPIFFHWVLASFLLVLGRYHRAHAMLIPGTPTAPTSRTTLVRTAQWSGWLAVSAGVLMWAAYQLAPMLLAMALDARPADNAVRIERRVAMTTRDGIRLLSDVYHPLRTTRTPTILVRVPCSKTMQNSLFATVIGRFWAERGYTVVLQGTRGRYESGGRHTPLVNEERDGIDTLNWLKAQPWFDGRLGMWGGSAFGYTQWVLAERMPTPSGGAASRSALMIQISSTDFHRMFYPGGAFSLSSALFWAVRSRGAEDVTPNVAALSRGFDGISTAEADDRTVDDIPFFNDWAGHPDRDDYWRAIDGDNRVESLRSPVMLTAGWFDPFLPGQLADFARIRTRGRPEVAASARLIIGPWSHAETVVLPGGVRNRNYRLESLAPSIAWFDRHLRNRGPGIQASAPVRLYVMGTNVWRDEQEWPLARARPTQFYLQSRGHANGDGGDGTLVTGMPASHGSPDVFIADPMDPVPTRGGSALGGSAGVVLQNDVERRRDVLVYSTPPLPADLEVTGPVSVTLYVSTSVPSADFTAKLVDVHPDGTAFNVTDGILRRGYVPVANHDNSNATEVDVELWPTSMVFRRAHRIRLEIAGSNFPRFDRNPHTAEPSAFARTTALATQVVHHGPATPSRIVLPVVPHWGRTSIAR